MRYIVNRYIFLLVFICNPVVFLRNFTYTQDMTPDNQCGCLNNPNTSSVETFVEEPGLTSEQRTQIVNLFPPHLQKAISEILIQKTQRSSSKLDRRDIPTPETSI